MPGHACMRMHAYVYLSGSSGIYGLDFYVHLCRPGLRVSKRKWARGRIGHRHRVTKEDSIRWFQQKYDGIVLNR